MLDQGADLAYRKALQAPAGERRLNAERGSGARVRAATNRLVVGAPAIDPQTQTSAWTVNVVSDPALDLVAYPGGQLIVHAGLVAAGTGLTDDELAAVLAHAMAHLLLGHDRRRVADAVPPSAAAAADPNARALAVAGAVAATRDKRYTDAEMAAADRASVELLARGLYDPRSAAPAWRKLAGGNSPLTRRYPVDEARLALLEAAGNAMLPVYEETKARAAQMKPPPVAPGSGGRSIR